MSLQDAMRIETTLPLFEINGDQSERVLVVSNYGCSSLVVLTDPGKFAVVVDGKNLILAIQNALNHTPK